MQIQDTLLHLMCNCAFCLDTIGLKTRKASGKQS